MNVNVIIISNITIFFIVRSSCQKAHYGDSGYENSEKKLRNIPVKQFLRNFAVDSETSLDISEKGSALRIFSENAWALRKTQKFLSLSIQNLLKFFANEFSEEMLISFRYSLEIVTRHEALKPNVGQGTSCRQAAFKGCHNPIPCWTRQSTARPNQLWARCSTFTTTQECEPQFMSVVCSAQSGSSHAVMAGRDANTQKQLRMPTRQITSQRMKPPSLGQHAPRASPISPATATPQTRPALLLISTLSASISALAGWGAVQ